MFSSILTGCISGMDAAIIRAEVDISTGLPGFCMVGSLGNEVKEAKERVQVALKNSGYHIPPNKITVNLSPANIRKDGTGFDVPVAVGLLLALGQFDEAAVRNMLFIGELGLNGEIKPVKGILPIVRAAAKAGVECCFVPYENRMEGSMIMGVQVRGVSNICQLVTYLKEDDDFVREAILPVCKSSFPKLQDGLRDGESLDFSQVKGQRMAKRAAEIAAAGFHNLAMSGPPGGGKSMIAKRIAGILPPLTEEECLEVSSIYSVAGMLSPKQPLILRRPFVNPHHTITYTAMVGGGGRIKPGAISLAHRGVLFLDELPQFPGPVLESLRQPLEERQIVISRNYGSYTYPAEFMFVCAMNPCRCGFFPERNRCTCTASELQHYWNKLSGPLMDRIDMYVETSRIELMHLSGREKEETTAQIQARVIQARKMQEKRFCDREYSFNGEMSATDVETYCSLGSQERKLMEAAYTKLNLSARAYHRVLRVARTIADLDGEAKIGAKHLSEALSYRFVERKV